MRKPPSKFVLLLQKHLTFVYFLLFSAEDVVLDLWERVLLNLLQFFDGY